MKLKTLNDLFPNIIDGEGLFSEMIGAPWQNDISGNDLDIFFFGNYGDKPINNIFKFIPKADSGELTTEGRQKVANLLLSKYKEQWTRLYTAFKVDYPILDTLLYNEQTTTTVSSSSDQTQTDKKTGTEKTDNTVTFDTNVATTDDNIVEGTVTRNNTLEKTGTDSSTENITNESTNTVNRTETVDETTTKKITGNSNTNQNIYGFNSSTAVPTDTQTGTGTSTENNKNDGTTTINETTKNNGSGKSDSTITHDTTDTFNESTTNNSTDNRTVDETKTGTESTDNTLTYDTTNTTTAQDSSNQTTEFISHKTGSSAIYTNQDVLQKEITLWTAFDFFKYVFVDVSMALTLGIYQIDY